MVYSDDGYHYENGNGEWGLFKILLVYFTILLCCYLLFGCAASKSSSVTENSDTTYIYKTDTVNIQSVREVSVEKYVDRYNDRFIKVNALGDTVIDRQKEYIYISDNKSISDSLSIFKSKIDSLSKVKQKKEYVYVEKSLSWWQKFQLDTYLFLLLSIFAVIAIVVFSFCYKIKNRLG